jgi:phosphate/sulfate permease
LLWVLIVAFVTMAVMAFGIGANDAGDSQIFL